jgi:hypothetical protein
MTFGFLNVLMLAGLAAAALPVLVHLLSRRRYQVVSWGAMQFLELGRRMRRRYRLEELLLLLLRIGLICLMVTALARPWAKGGLFSGLTHSAPRDIAVVIDGSYSMGWEGDAVTPHADAVQEVHELVEKLGDEDTLALLDARDQVRTVIAPPTSDGSLVRDQLDALPPPAGTSSLAAAATAAAQLLLSGEHLDRDVLLLSDGQALCWSPEDQRAWRRLDEMVRQSSVPPQIWAVVRAPASAGRRANFLVDRLSLSRELTVPDFPLRIETSIRQMGGTATQREVYFAVNGQRLGEKTVTVNLPPNGEARVAFEHRFAKIGSYDVSVSVGPDVLPGDNRSDAAVVVEEGIPVLLVDGHLDRDPTQSETFFVHSALSPSQSASSWVVSRVVDADGFTGEAIQGQRVVVLANVPRLSDAQVELLQRFVMDGGGLVVAPGDRINPEFYNAALFVGGRGLLPARFDVVRHERDHGLGDVNLVSDSLEASWLRRFRRENGVDLTEARFAHWWRLADVGEERSAFGSASHHEQAGHDQPRASARRLISRNALASGSQPLPAGDAPTSGHSPTSGAEDAIGDDGTHTGDLVGETLIAARLDPGDAFMVTRRFGRGTVVQLAVPLDSDWSTLPAKNDFVPFLHEMVFHLASHTSGRNVEPGMPLLLELPADADPATGYEFVTPDGRTLPAEIVGVEADRQARLIETGFPGVYRAQASDRSTSPEYFVVHTDRQESDLTPLSPQDRKRLAENNRIRFVTSVEEVLTGMADDVAPTELWRVLLLAVLAILVAEVLMTRRLVQGGHEVVDS